MSTYRINVTDHQDACTASEIIRSEIINVNYLCAKTSNHAITWFLDIATFFFFFSSFFFFFIKCMQSMTMTLSRRCAYVKLHVSWSKSLLYIFSLINHIDSLRKQALSIKQLLSLVLSFSHLFMFFSLYSFVFNSHFLVAIQVLFKYFSIAILSILMINNVNIVFMFLNCAFALSCNCSAL